MGLYSLFRPRFDRRSSMTYLYVVLITFALLVILPAGAFWQRERYLFLILPLLFLISGQVLVRLMGRLPLPSLARGWGVALLPLLVTLFVGLTGTREAYPQEWGYDLAFRYLRDRWNPDEGDLIVTPMSTASMLYLGRNDFFAIQQGYEEYIVSRPGDHLPADLWTATPIITSTAEFVQILTDAPRVWFVTDGWRFQTRYNTDFIVTVLNHMELEFNERGAMVFRADGYEPLPEPPVQHDRRVDFGDQIALTGFDLSSVGLGPGDTLGIRLRWQSLDGARPAYTVFLHLVRPDGRGVAGVDELLLGGFYQPDLWPPSQVVPDRHQVALPFSLEPGRYRLDLGLYLPGEPDEKLSAGGSERIPLAMIPVGETQQARLPSTAVAVDVDYGPIRLLGYELEHAQRDTPYALDLTLYWQATAPVDRDYSVFVHLVDQEGDLVTQDDAPPGDPFFGTTTWLPGVIVPDRHALSLPAGSPLGDYLLRVGLYHPSSEDRLPATGPSGEPLGDSLQIDPVRVGSSSP
jgi:hypothetical protein